MKNNNIQSQMTKVLNSKDLNISESFFFETFRNQQTFVYPDNKTFMKLQDQFYQQLVCDIRCQDINNILRGICSRQSHSNENCYHCKYRTETVSGKGTCIMRFDWIYFIDIPSYGLKTSFYQLTTLDLIYKSK